MRLSGGGFYEYQSDFARKYFFEGKAEGKAVGRAELLLKLLRLRGFVVPEGLQRDISGCTDIDRLDRWAGRLLTANSLADVFADDAP